MGDMYGSNPAYPNLETKTGRKMVAPPDKTVEKDILNQYRDVIREKERKNLTLKDKKLLILEKKMLG